MRKAFVLGWAVLFVLASAAGSSAAGTSSGIMMNRIASVRAQGMGGAHTAVVSDEAGATGWNPACLYGNDGMNLSAAYFRGVDEDSYGALNFDMAGGKHWSAGAGLQVYDAGVMELNIGDDTSNVTAERDFLGALTGAYGIDLYGFDAVGGANLKFLHSTLVEKYSAFAAALDLGARVSRKDIPVQAGLVLRNLGTSVKYAGSEDSLPGAVLMGLAYDAYRNETFKVLLAGDLQYDFEDRWRSHWGVEAKVTDMFALRGGYQTGYDLGYLTMGFSVRYANITMEYAYRPMQELNSIHSASLTYAFGGQVQQAETAPVAVSEPDYMPVVAGTGRTGSTNRVRAEILEVQKSGGRPMGVVLNLGEQQQIQVGYRGTLYSASGRPLCGFRIRQVTDKISLAELTGLSREIADNAFAVIDLPEKQ